MCLGPSSEPTMNLSRSILVIHFTVMILSQSTQQYPKSGPRIGQDGTHFGPQIALGLLVIPAASQIFLGFVIYDKKTSDDPSTKKRQAMENLGGAIKGMYETIKIPQVWKPSLYMYLSLALSFSTHEGQFYWYTDPKAGPAFSQELVGMVHVIGALASIVGVLVYHKLLKDCPFRKLLFFAQLLYGLSGFLDLML